MLRVTEAFHCLFAVTSKIFCFKVLLLMEVHMHGEKTRITELVGLECAMLFQILYVIAAVVCVMHVSCVHLTVL